MGNAWRRGHVLTGWLIASASDALLKYREVDGDKTAYELITGHKCRHKVFGFGECVQFRLPVGKTSRDKLDGDWLEGYYLGRNSRTT